MPVYWLTKDLVFPPPEGATPEGLVAAGGDFAPERLILAYSQGIFPWPHEGYPLLWFSPDPRYILVPSEVHVSRSLRKTTTRGTYQVRMDTNFGSVIRACGEAPRPGQAGTWITDELIAGYEMLFARGFAHSIEAYEDGALVGGLYGLSLGRAFFGESMFATRPDASKVAFVYLCEFLAARDFDFIDCQVHTAHLERFGAKPIPRTKYLDLLHRSVAKPGLETWT